MTTQADIAALYRALNATYRPFAEGDLALWQTLSQEMIDELCQQAEVANAADRSWRRVARFTGCAFGPKGCPPWSISPCVACQGAATHHGHPRPESGLQRQLCANAAIN